MTSASTRSADAAYDSLLRDIVGARLAPGARLIEAQVSKRLDISRTPLREAFFRLEQDGFVESEPRRGCRVRLLTEREARETYPIVAALESEGVRESAQLIRTDIPRLRKTNRALLAARRNAVRAIQVDRAFHMMLVERSANALLVRLVRNLHRVLFRYEVVYMSDPALIARSVEQHDAIIKAIATAKIGLACEAVCRNYETGMRAVIEKIRER